MYLCSQPTVNCVVDRFQKKEHFGARGFVASLVEKDTRQVMRTGQEGVCTREDQAEAEEGVMENLEEQGYVCYFRNEYSQTCQLPR